MPKELFIAKDDESIFLILLQLFTTRIKSRSLVKNKLKAKHHPTL